MEKKLTKSLWLAEKCRNNPLRGEIKHMGQWHSWRCIMGTLKAWLVVMHCTGHLQLIFQFPHVILRAAVLKRKFQHTGMSGLADCATKRKTDYSTEGIPMNHFFCFAQGGSGSCTTEPKMLTTLGIWCREKGAHCSRNWAFEKCGSTIVNQRLAYSFPWMPHSTSHASSTWMSSPLVR